MEIIIILAALVVLVAVTATLISYEAEPPKNFYKKEKVLTSTWPFPTGEERPVEKRFVVKKETTKPKKVTVVKNTKPASKPLKANRKNKQVK